MKRIVVLISGRGSNLHALLNSSLGSGRIVAVISDKAEALGIQIAQAAQVPCQVVAHESYPNRKVFDQMLQEYIAQWQPDAVVLAGFMRILSPALVEQYRGRLFNIHPSLLPAFPGLSTHARALQAGVRLHGCSVHFVDVVVDEGPIIAQAAVPVWPEDDVESLAKRVLSEEHRLYAKVLRWWCDGRFSLTNDNKVHWVPPLVPEIRSLCVP